MTTYADLAGTKMGAIFKRALDIRAAQTTFAPPGLTTTTGLNSIRAVYGGDEMSLLAAVADSDQLGDFGRPAMEALRTAAHRSVIDTVNILSSVPLHTRTIGDAFREMAATLIADSDSFDGNDTAGSAAARSGNTGTGIVACTAYGPTLASRGVSLSAAAESQFIRNEKWKVTCIADANAGRVAGNEGFRIDPARGYDNLDRRWRGGTGGASAFVSATSALAVESSREVGQNILANSAFERENTTANLPDQWTARTGSVGTDIATTSTAWDGSKAVRLIGGGTANPCVGQLLGASTGSLITAIPDTTYCVSLWTRSNSGTVSKTITAQFADSSGTSIGLSGLASVTVSSHTTSYSRTTGFIHTPANLSPGTYYFDLRNTGTTLAGGEEVYIDGLVVAPVIRLAPMSGGIVILGGATQFRTADHFDVTWTNDDAGTMLYWFDCLFDCYGNGYVLPFNLAGSETLADTLVA